MIASYSNPRKTREVFWFALKEKLLRFGFGVFGACRQKKGKLCLFLDVFMTSSPPNEPKWWLKLWLHSRLKYEALEP